MKSLFENLSPGVYQNSVEYVFEPSELAEKLLFYPTWVGHYYCSSSYYINQEYDSFYLFYIVKGKMHVEYMGESYDAEPNDLIILDGQAEHSCNAYEGLEFYYYGFNGANAKELVSHVLKSKGSLLRSKNNYVVRKCMEKAMDCYEEYDTEDPFTASQRIYEMLMLVLHEDDMTGEEPNEMITQSIYYIRENLHKRITMEQLAHMVGLSPAYFSYLFKQKTGYSPREYIMDARMNKAKTLLLRTDKTIAEIADHVGYTNAVSLTNLFKKRVGLSPLSYRKKMRNSQTEE